MYINSFRESNNSSGTIAVHSFVNLSIMSLKCVGISTTSAPANITTDTPSRVAKIHLWWKWPWKSHFTSQNFKKHSKPFFLLFQTIWSNLQLSEHLNIFQSKKKCLTLFFHNLKRISLCKHCSTFCKKKILMKISGTSVYFMSHSFLCLLSFCTRRVPFFSFIFLSLKKQRMLTHVTAFYARTYDSWESTY